MIVFDVGLCPDFAVTDRFTLPIRDSRDAIWELRGAIYHGFNHFTARYVASDKSVWYHDGATTGRHCLREADGIELLDLRTARGRRVSHYLYVHDASIPLPTAHQ